MIPKHRTRGVLRDALAYLVPPSQVEYFQVEVGRNTVLRSRTGAEIHIPAFFLNTADRAAEAHLKVSTSGTLDGLFSMGLHTKATARCLSLHYAIQISRMDGLSRFDPPLFVDIPCPSDRWRRSQTRLYGWSAAQLHIDKHPGWEWQPSEGQVMPRIRKFNSWYYRILLYDDTWAGCLYPFSQEHKRCMISVDLEGWEPEDEVQVGLRIQGEVSWIPLHRSGQKWVGMALPAGLGARLWAIGYRLGCWHFGQVDIPALGNQKWTLRPEAVPHTDARSFLQNLLRS